MKYLFSILFFVPIWTGSYILGTYGPSQWFSFPTFVTCMILTVIFGAAAVYYWEK